uniref:(northern house mosquito) hypothetical protein n=1 Tax=Culex pipiens TaxID=7175 RepID=A0A8D8CFD0_CULPI
MCARSLFCTCACVVVGVSTAALLGRWFHRYYTATVCGDISGLIHNLAHKLHQFQALWQTFTCTFLPKCRQHARHTHSHSPIVLTFPNFCPVTLKKNTSQNNCVVACTRVREGKKHTRSAVHWH